jgi:predicted nuclease with TOPRIM domain
MRQWTSYTNEELCNLVLVDNQGVPNDELAKRLLQCEDDLLDALDEARSLSAAQGDDQDDVYELEYQVYQLRDDKDYLSKELTSLEVDYRELKEKYDDLLLKSFTKE